MTDEAIPITNESENRVTSLPDDVSKMKNSDIKWRSKYKSTVAEKEELQRNVEKFQSEKAELTQRVDATIKAAHTRIIEAELRALAISEGIKDLDFTKLIDLSTAKVNENGDIIGLKEAVIDFKTKKPALFGTDKMTSSSSNQGNVSETAIAKVDARTMSEEEYKKARTQFGLR